MKRLTAVLLMIALLLSGCTSGEPLAEAPEEDTSVSTKNTNPLEPSQSESENVSEDSTPEETTPPTDEETSMNPEEEGTEDMPDTQPTQPGVGEENQTPVEPEPPADPEPVPPTSPEPVDPPPTTPEPEPSNPGPSKPTTSNRPTSSATCRDTGSNKIWNNPAANQRHKYEETEPSRVEYLEFLAKEGNPYMYFFTSEEILMYLGRTYGMPLYTSREIMAASVWSISDPSVATINQVGFVVPVNEGHAVVTVTYVDSETQEIYTYDCDIYVEKEPVYTFAMLEQMAKEEAKAIADYLTNEFTFNNDLELIAAAATVIQTYVEKGHETSLVDGYNQPFGTLVTGYSSCAGSTRALGLVLEYLGFEWYHINENQWSHQWCVVYDVDGQTAFADGSVLGIAGYGERLEDMSNWMWYKNGALSPVV